MGKLPLEGIRVADFTWWYAGPWATRALANHGAEVIKIESTTQRDIVRDQLPTREGTSGFNASHGFAYTNPSKLSITINPKHPKGLELVKRIVAVSDVVADNMTWGAMERLGLGYEELVKVKADIIVLSMPVMAPGGPYAQFSGTGNQIAAMAALDHLTGYPDGLGMAPGPVLPDWNSNPFHGATAVLAALHYRNKTGKGQQILLSQYESVVNVAGLAILDYCANGRIQTRMGNRSPYGAPHGIYRCQGEDRWCAVAVFTDTEWEGMCRAMGNPEWSQDGRFATVLGRVQHADELDQCIEEWTSERQAEEVTGLLQREGVAAGMVQNPEDLLERDPQMKERGHYVPLEHPEIGSMHIDADAYRLSDTPGRLRRHAPLLGEHNDYVCSEILGMSEDEINELIIEEVLE